MDTTLEKRQFPVGKFKMQINPTDAHLQEWIATIAAFPGQLRELTRPMDNAQLDMSYRPGGWTLRQVVHHCADSHANAYIRLKSALTEDFPVIKPYDQDAWAKLPDSRLPIAVSLDLIEALHTRWVALMRAMQPSDWSRGYFHPEHKRQIGLVEFAAQYAWHCETHLGHVRIVAEAR